MICQGQAVQYGATLIDCLPSLMSIIARTIIGVIVWKAFI